jgi:hypothetical protein
LAALHTRLRLLVCVNPKSIQPLGMGGENQTARTAPNDFDGYSASQRVSDVKTPAGRTGMLRRDYDPVAPAVCAASIVGFGGLAAGSATAQLRRQLQHPVVAIECDVKVAGGVHRHIQRFGEPGERQHGLGV